MNEETRPIEIWGGVECTINRVGDRYHDQLKRSRHLTRLEDIDRFAALGITALRTPLIWERCAPERGQRADFSDFDPMLQRLREHKLRPIAGLVHHGSGPRYTSLMDPQFEHELARYAREAAEAYPWIEDYTPVNEPLTTARFSGLYGFWYPHAADNPSFLRALVHECRGTIRAMRAIREVQPRARLVQTEDIANVRSTPLLAYQARYENDRRFLSFDLLCGRIDRDHFLYPHLLENGVTEEEIAWFQENACPPDLLGMNYYFTSDRYLDENLSAYPEWSHGGNGRHAYADMDSGKIPGVGLVGHRRILQLVWERYKLPVALTEVHAGCTREEQLRWLGEAWEGAHEARAAGADVRAMTVWAMLGSYDWNSLVRVENGVYEPGIFDLRTAEPRPTALAHMTRALATTGSYDHPVLESEGWWHRATGGKASLRNAKPRPLLITGGRGALAQAFARSCEVRGLKYELLHREQLDIADPASVRDVLRKLSPWAIVNAAGFAQPEAAERSPSDCRRAHTDGPVLLAEECSARGLRLLTFSSDHVFDGSNRRPYVESDGVGPLSLYGKSQAEAERRILEMDADAMIVRTSAMFGPHDARNVIAQTLAAVSSGRSVSVPFDSVVSPTYSPHLVESCLDLLIDGAAQLWHLANVGEIAWPAFLRRLAETLKLPSELIQHEPMVKATRAPRPTYSVLGSERGVFMPTLEQALEHWGRERAVLGGAPKMVA